jgi:dTDP-4-amino-4,6-dideoxygalactose transaminase/nucleoside-diphosphate-sugar epimerase
MSERLTVARDMDDAGLVLVGGSGFIGTAICDVAVELGCPVTVVDRQQPRFVDDFVDWLPADPLVDDVQLPEGRVVVLIGGGHPRPRWPWTVPLDTCLATARLLPRLRRRKVTLISSVEVYGYRVGLLSENEEPCLPWSRSALDEWCRDALLLSRDTCPPWRAAALCRSLASAGHDERWVYGLAKRAQELLLAQGDVECELTVLRVANTFGIGQERVVSQLVRRALAGLPLTVVRDVVRSFVPVDEVARLVVAGLPPGVYNVGGHPIALTELADLVRSTCDSTSPVAIVAHNGSDSSGLVDSSLVRATGFEPPSLEDSLEAFVHTLRSERTPLFAPAIPVVVPPRPVFPDWVAERQQACLWGGALKSGNRWSAELRERLAETLQLPDSHDLLVTASGTEALRLAIVAVAPRPEPGDVAILPSFTFPATAEVLRQLGYALHYVDVQADTWTIDANAVREALAVVPAKLVVCVDTFGNPCDYARVRAVCRDADIPLIADSAASLGSLHRGAPVAMQADAHAYSMSFAKVLSAGGSGGAVVLPSERLQDLADWTRSALMDELHAIPALDQLAILPELVERRNAIASVYAEGVGPFRGLKPQTVRPLDRHSYVHWVVRISRPARRTTLERGLAALGVETKRYFTALHVEDKSAASHGPLPITEQLHDAVLALPMSSELTVEDAQAVIAAVVECSLAARRPALATSV